MQLVFSKLLLVFFDEFCFLSMISFEVAVVGFLGCYEGDAMEVVKLESI